MSYQNIDTDVEIMLQIEGKPIPRDRIHVHLSGDYNRKKLPVDLENKIDSCWTARLKKNPKLWNGTKFRLESAKQHNDLVTMNIGITSYKDFIGTNWSPNAQDYKEMGGAHYQNPQAHFSDALGVGAMVETKDNHFILLRRSQQCGEAVGLLDIPGGHPEPQVPF